MKEIRLFLPCINPKRFIVCFVCLTLIINMSNFYVKRSVTKPYDHLDKKDPFQMTDFINQFVTANEWKWDEITFYNCKRIEFLIQKNCLRALL